MAFVATLFVASAAASGWAMEESRTIHGDRMRRIVDPSRIPPILAPEFVPAGDAVLGDGEPLVSVGDREEARAYGLWLLNDHEVVNDRLGSDPFAVFWCPLINMAVAWSRRLEDGRVLTFRASGSLLHNTLVVRDDETGTLWNSLTGEAVSGPLAHQRLAPLPSWRASWAAWRRVHPEGRVLSVQGRQSPRSDSYESYHRSTMRVGLQEPTRRDARLPAKSLVVGLDLGMFGVAVPVDRFERGVFLVTYEGTSVLLHHDGQGVVAAFLTDLGSTSLVFDFDAAPPENDGRSVRDRDTGTLWDLATGRALAGPLAGTAMTRFPPVLAYWFAWADHRPRTRLRPRGS